MNKNIARLFPFFGLPDALNSTTGRLIAAKEQGILPLASAHKSLYTCVKWYIHKYQEDNMSTKLALKAARQFDTSAIEQADLSPQTRRQYINALNNYLVAGGQLTDAAALAAYAAALPVSTRSFLKAAIRLNTRAQVEQLKAGANPDNLPMVQAALLRLEAMRDTIKVQRVKGEKAGTWLSAAQVKQLMESCGDDIVGRRDWVVLALMVGAGLRRDEVAHVDCKDLIEQPGKNGKTRLVVQVHGKGKKERPVPVSAVLAARVRAWCEFIGCGLAARSLGRLKELGGSLSGQAVLAIVRKHGKAIGIELDPHDLRRTYAQLGRDAGVPIEQISQLLGHENIQVTARYLNINLDLESTVSDFIPLE